MDRWDVLRTMSIRLWKTSLLKPSAAATSCKRRLFWSTQISCGELSSAKLRGLAVLRLVNFPIQYSKHAHVLWNLNIIIIIVNNNNNSKNNNNNSNCYSKFQKESNRYKYQLRNASESLSCFEWYTITPRETSHGLDFSHSKASVNTCHSFSLKNSLQVTTWSG